MEGETFRDVASVYAESEFGSVRWKSQRRQGLHGQALELEKMLQREFSESLAKARSKKDAEYDRGRYVRNVLCIINACLGILIMMIAAGINWDGHKLKSHDGADALKMIVSISSFILVLQISEYHRFKISYLFTNYVRSTEIPLDVFSKSGPILVLESIICGYHIPPFCSDYISDKWMIFMFFRIYLLLRFLRDISPISEHRNRIISHGFYHLGGSTLNSWLFHARTFIYRAPGTFMLTIAAILYLIMSYSIYLFEREAQDDFDFKRSLWYTAVTMTTAGFGDTVAKSHYGRILAVMSGALGIALSSFCVTIAASVLNLSNHQKFANDIVDIQGMDRSRLESAATVIQCWWRLLKLQRENKHDAMIEYRCRRNLLEATNRLRRHRKMRKNISLYGEDPVTLTRLRLEGRFDPVLNRILKTERICNQLEKRTKLFLSNIDSSNSNLNRTHAKAPITPRTAQSSLSSTRTMQSPANETPTEDEVVAKIMMTLDRMVARINRLEHHISETKEERHGKRQIEQDDEDI